MKKKISFLIIIPARFKSSRLPGKPLLKIKKIPMIIRTCRQCLKAVSHSKIVVATDDIRIKNICRDYGFNSIITKKNCLTGTDRVAEIAKKTNFSHYINIQGDEPIFNPKDIRNLLININKHHEDVLLGYTKIKKINDFINPNIPKIIFDNKKYLVYSSRASIPYSQLKKKIKAYKGVWAYAYPRNKLMIFSNNKEKTPLERIEDIEILRFIDLGIKVKMIKMSGMSKSVDIKSDIKKIESFL
jgi:3-deoxy-manno-octulosonate cytidylyltransferase (CMP-KDO synthetase)